MQLEKDQAALSPDESSGSADDLQDDTTKWLLDRDHSDPVEGLFTVEEGKLDATLTEFEAEMAGRPMFRGSDGGDDMSAIFGEEIVVSEVGGESDIYAASNGSGLDEEFPEAPLAVDHTTTHHPQDVHAKTVVEDGQDILSLDDDDDIGEHCLILVKPAFGLEGSKKLQLGPEIKPEIETEAEPEPEPEIETELEVEPEIELEIETELEAETQLEIEAELEVGAEAELESVDDYIASTPAPVDDAEFDEYLLGGQAMEGAEADSSVLQIENTDDMAGVDTEVDTSNIDYHEDFQMNDVSRGNTVSVITGVIAQVMDEVTTSVEQRLSDLCIDTQAVQVEVMLGNDVESIIECVTDGYAPIVEIRPKLPAALRQLGQTEVDAIYVRISHNEIPGNWNDLFADDFVAPGSTDELGSLDVAVEPQPFAELDLDTFEFEGSDEADALDVHSFDDALTPYSESSGDDPLSSIDFATVIAREGELPAPDKAPELQHEGSSEEPLDIDVHDDRWNGLASIDQSDTSWCIPGNISFSFPGDAHSELFVDFLDVFIEEATAELEKLEDALGVWEAGDNVALPAPVSHSLHTLKGIAKGVGLQHYGTLIHNYETLLDGLPACSSEDDKPGYFRIVNAWLDAAVQGFELIESSRMDIRNVLPVSTQEQQSYEVPKDHSSEDLSLGQQSQNEAQPINPVSVKLSTPALMHTEGSASIQVSQQLDDQKLADEGAKTLAAQQTIRMSAETLDKLLNLTNQSQQLGVRASESTVRSKLAAAEALAHLSSVRAHIVKISDRALSNVSAKGGRSASELDALEMDQYSELQEAANILRESVEDLDDLIRLSSRQISTAEALLKQQASAISSLGSSIQEARVVPVSRLIPGLRRIVRTVGADLGKTVSFKVLNQVGTLDRDNYARCQVILEHMVRNAMDHGIESSQQRIDQGKPAEGKVSIDVNKKGADYIITLSDDGRGVDPVLMRETAYNRGLDIDVDALTDDEAIQLIFHKGFTTATAVSEISGRGVGMDIVLSELREIGGDVQIESTVGEGTRFHIRIPPNVSVNGALLVSAGNSSYAIPLDGLIAVDYVDVDQFFDAVEQNSKLALFGVEAEPAYLATICHNDSLPERSAWNRSVPVLIAGSEDRYMAIAVDDVKQALELVIRSLGVQFSAVPGVAGATTTADGQAVVALDLNALVKSVGSEEHTPVSLAREAADQLLVLVVDDSRTQRMVSTSQFEKLGVDTVTAENGMVAIDLLNTTNKLPDVILLDVEMPVKDGIQTLREIRKSVRYCNIPVIMVTSRTGAKHRALADEAGCDGYMGKPFNFPVLVKQISELTGYKLETS